MKARLLQLVTVMLIGVALAGCAGTGPTRVSCADVMKQDAAKQAAPVSYSAYGPNC